MLGNTIVAPTESKPLVLAASAEKQFEVSLARTQFDLTESFELLYDAYVRAGLTKPNSVGVRVTPYHTVKTTEVFVAKTSNVVISTLTMTADSDMGLPMESMYVKEVARLKRYARVAEMGCLADRREAPVRFVRVFPELARLVVQVATSRGIDALVLAVHPRHAKFYARAFGFKPFGGIASCPYAQGNPAIAMVMDFDSLQGTAIHDKLFGNPVAPEDLQQTLWTEEVSNYIRTILAQQASLAGDTRIAG